MQHAYAFALEHWDEILGALSLALGAAAVVAKWTKTKKDDEAVSWLQSALAFIPRRKGKK